MGLLNDARAADHRDGPAVLADPSTDITDIYSWMPDTTHVALVMNVSPSATTLSRFSTTAKYVFHTASYTQYLGTADPEVNVICTFDAMQKVSCWVGPQAYVSGDASNVAGLATADGKVRVFTGLRDDPFFFNLDGFKTMQSSLIGALGTLTFDAAGCPAVSAGVVAALVGQLSHGLANGPPADNFAAANVLSIVVLVDKTLLLSNGHSILGVWGSTHT